MSGATTQTTRRSTWPLWVLIGVFALPVVAAWFFYLNPQYLPSNRVNKGELIEPQVPLSTGVAPS